MTFDTADREVMDIINDAEEALPLETKKTAKVLADVVGSVDSDWAGSRAPRSVAAACLYVADWIARGPEAYTQREFYEETGVSHVTLAKHYREVPTVFFEMADDEDLDRLSDIAQRRLEVLRDAREVGFDLHDIDPWTHSVRD